MTNVFCPVTSFMWGKRDGTLFTDDLNEAYDKIVFWRLAKECFYVMRWKIRKGIRQRSYQILKGMDTR